MITPLYTGRFTVQGFGAVGSLAAARRGRYCRRCEYWCVVEFDDTDIPQAGGFGARCTRKRGNVERLDLGKWKTKRETIAFLNESAKEMGLELIGDITGYPRLEITTPHPIDEI